MKKLLTALILMMGSPSAFAAPCLFDVQARVNRSLTARGHSYHRIKQEFGVDVLTLAQQSEELSDEQRAQIRTLLQSDRYEFFLITASAGPAGYQELHAVNKNSCATYRRYRTFVE